jgi:hypothetical protein
MLRLKGIDSPHLLLPRIGANRFQSRVAETILFLEVFGGGELPLYGKRNAVKERKVIVLFKEGGEIHELTIFSGNGLTLRFQLFSIYGNGHGHGPRNGQHFNGIVLAVGYNVFGIRCHRY